MISFTPLMSSAYFISPKKLVRMVLYRLHFRLFLYVLNFADVEIANMSSCSIVGSLLFVFDAAFSTDFFLAD